MVPPRAIAAVPLPPPMPLPAEDGVRPEELVESYRRLAEVFHHVLSEQSLDALLERITHTLGDLVPHEALHIYEADEERRALAPVVAREPQHAEQVLRNHVPFGEGLTGWAAEHRTPVWTNQAHLDPRTTQVKGTPLEPEAIIVVPLIARGLLKGVLNIYRIGEEARFLEHEFELAKWFADAAALALDNAQTRARLEHLAQTDSLTGLYNHRYFHERLRAELTRASRTHGTVAVLMFDLDDFKRVNDVHGHGAGDQLLAGVARLAREEVRGSDVVCRIGGEEFGVILPACDAGDALVLAARICERLRTSDLQPTGGVTISLGVAQGPHHAMNPRELVACAEAAMMTAKARGKNQVVLFGDGEAERPAVEHTVGRDVRSIAHMKMLQSLAGKLNRLNDVGQIAGTIATELRLLIDYHNCRVFLRDGNRLRPIAFVGDLDERAGRAEDVYATEVGVGITGRVVQTGEPMLVPNALECEFAQRIPGTDELEESLAVVPLRYATRVTGAIVISKLGTDQFDEDDVRLLEVLAGQASVALENARLYEQQRREAENAKALLAFADDVAGADSFEEVCERTVVAAAELFGVDRVTLWLDGGCAATVGDPLDTGLEAQLSEGDGVSGRIVVGSAGASEDERRLLSAFTYQASVALQKARLYWKQHEAAEIANALLDVSRELATAEGLDEVLQRTAEAAARVLNAARAALWIEDDADPGHSVVARAAHGYDDVGEWTWNRLPYETAQQLLAGRDGPFVIDRDVVVRIAGDGDDWVARTVVAPLRLEGRLAGLSASIGDKELDHRRLQLVAGLAHQAKLAIESAEHYSGLERTFVSTVTALANALEANDEYTSSHARWITDMALCVGRELDLDRETLKRLEFSALFHDIGKIGIPSEILQKPGPLTDEEFEVIKTHPELGEKILQPIDRLADVRPIVRACHERWDGNGYPDGKAGAGIPLEARIVLVCDAFHAMVTDRPYREALPQTEAVRRLREAAGTQFDPSVVEAFARLHADGAVLPLA